MSAPEQVEYPPETIGSVMSRNIPTFRPNTSLHTMLRRLATQSWDSIRTMYVVDDEHQLLGVIDLPGLAQQNHTATAEELMRKATDVLHPHDDQEKAVFLAVKDNDAVLPVTDSHNRLLGAVTARSIVSIMHEEHIEDALLSSGIRRGKQGLRITKLATERTGLIVRSRAPWLIVGLVTGLGLGLISSLFEKSLQETIALAYFIPVVAYIADSVGTQSEAIAIRALATLKINFWRALRKELLVGLALGVIVGMLGFAGAYLVGRSFDIALVVGLSLFVASTVAAVLAVIIPMAFKAAGKDPALGSGPVATAIQDVISIVIYFLFAALII